MQRLTHQDKLISILADGKWHNAKELVYRISWRYPARMGELRRKGYKFGKQRAENGLYEWNLEYVPTKPLIGHTKSTEQPKQDKLFEVRGQYV